MKNKLVTAGVVVLVLAGITAFNRYFEQQPVTLAQQKEAEATAEKLEQHEHAEGEEHEEGAPPKIESEAPAPDVYKAKLETTKGDVVIEVHKEWAPLAAQRFYDLVKSGYYDDNRLFRMVPGFVVQWGINGTPSIAEKWESQRLQDEPVKQSNTAGMVSFAMGGPNSRTTQVFINLGDNSRLDTYGQGFAPFGKVIEGMEVVNSFNSKYNDNPTAYQHLMRQQGNKFTDARFPGLDSIEKATIVE